MMEQYNLYDAEYRFVSIVWDLEPVNSTTLSKVCAEKLGWKKSTAYNMLRKMCERGILKNENATVIALIKRDQIQKYESEALLQKSFNESLPAFIATFLKGKKLNKEEALQIHKMIEEATK